MTFSANRTDMRIAVIATVWTPFSHADVIVSRWLESLPSDGRHGFASGSARIVSVWIDQSPPHGIGRGVCQDHHIPVYTSLRDALYCGGSEPAVDAVLLIAEHGEYPVNAFGQKLYPRWEFFTEIVDILENAGVSVPVFVDKHLSWSFTLAQQMVDRAQKMGIPLYAGSSIPHCPMLPNEPILPGEEISEVLALFSGDPEHYGFHMLEFAQSIVEKRMGGEGGITKVRRMDDGGLKDALDSGEVSRELLRATFAHAGFSENLKMLDFFLKRTRGAYAFQLQHSDGLKVTHLCLPNIHEEWVLAIRRKNGDYSVAKAVGGNFPDFFSNFACLNRVVLEFFRTSKAPNPIERTLLAGGALEAILRSEGGLNVWHETPHLEFGYTPQRRRPA